MQTIPGYTTSSTEISDIEKLKETFWKEGLLHFKGVLKNDPSLLAYIKELSQLTCQLLEDFDELATPDEPLNQLITRLHRCNAAYPRYLHGLCSNPSKLVSAAQLKYHSLITNFCRIIFGKEAIIATPSKSDLISFFFPNKSFVEYNLPVHQDFQYMMQSPRQIVVWIPLCERAPKIGSIRLWQKSHQKGIRKAQITDGFQYEVVASADELNGYEEQILDWEFGDIIFMHSLLLHQTVENEETDHTRVVQIYRFSDLNDATSRSLHWRSTDYVDQSKGPFCKSIKFEESFPDLIKPGS